MLSLKTTNLMTVKVPVLQFSYHLNKKPQLSKVFLEKQSGCIYLELGT